MKKLILLSALALTGCATKSFTLPNITASSIDITERDPMGGTTIHAEGVVTNADGTVEAKLASWATTYPSFSGTLVAKDFKQTPKQQQSPAPVVSIRRP